MSVALPTGAVVANRETAQFASGSGDIADDPAIWVDAASPSRSVVIGSKKASTNGGVAVYDLSGTQLQFLAAGELNNVDIRTGVLGNRVLVIATNRTNRSLRYFWFDPGTRRLSSTGSTATGFEPYGACLYVSPINGNVYAFVTQRATASGQFDQYRLTVSGSTVSGVKVRDLGTATLSEGCVADDAARGVFLGEEERGLFRYGAEPGAGSARTAVGTVGDGHLVADVEGVTIAKQGTGGSLIVSSQGNSTFQVYDRAAPHTWRGSFSVGGSGSVDAVTGADGVDVTTANLGAAYPSGLLVTHDATNSGGTTSNYKYVDLTQILGGNR